MIEGEVEELDEERRPYAPAANVLAVVERVRRRNLPDAIDTDFARVAGVPEASIARVLYALRFLRLIGSDGRPTDRLRAIARATEEEYRELLSGVVQTAYSADFERVSPAEDTQARIISAFQRYEPRSQTTRMVMLWLGLARAAGIPVLEAPRERQMQPPKVSRSVVVRGRAVKKSDAPALRVIEPEAAKAPVDTPKSDPNLLFGVTFDDIAALGTDFNDVWTALGKVALARARNLQARKEQSAPASEQVVEGEATEVAEE